MYIPAYAFTKNEQEEQKKRWQRFQKIKNLNQINIHTIDIQVGYCIYKGSYREVTEFDIAIFCDKGCVCFGGHVSVSENKFTCKIYTD